MQDTPARANTAELAACLRAWRRRTPTGAAGTGALSGPRRFSGVRQQDVAERAGVSVDYIARLEQERAPHPSPSVLAALARALELSDAERVHLFRLAGQVEPQPGRMPRFVSPGLQRLLRRFDDLPVQVFDLSRQIIAANRTAVALIGDHEELSEREQNWIWRLFVGPPHPLVMSGEQKQAVAEQAVAELLEAVVRYPSDDRLRRLIADLREASVHFASLWEERPVGRAAPGHRTVAHPRFGLATFQVEMLTVTDSDLRLVIWTAEPGSREADILAGLTGSQG